MELNGVSLNVVGLNRVGLNVVGGVGGNENRLIPPKGEPPVGALVDVNGKFIVDRRGKYIVTTEI